MVCQVDFLENSQNGKTGGFSNPNPLDFSASHDPRHIENTKGFLQQVLCAGMVGPETKNRRDV